MDDNDDEIKHQAADFVWMRSVLLPGNKCYPISLIGNGVKSTIKDGTRVGHSCSVEMSRLDTLGIDSSRLANMRKANVLSSMNGQQGGQTL